MSDDSNPRTSIPVRGTYRDITADLILDGADRAGAEIRRTGTYIMHGDTRCSVCACGGLALVVEPRLADADFYSRTDYPIWRLTMAAYQLSAREEQSLSEGFEGQRRDKPRTASEAYLYAVGASVARRAGLDGDRPGPPTGEGQS